jgi:hypothetical protein
VPKQGRTGRVTYNKILLNELAPIDLRTALSILISGLIEGQQTPKKPKVCTDLNLSQAKTPTGVIIRKGR